MPRNVHFLRIDDRLIHGQVIVGWLPHLGSKVLLVANEKVAVDKVRQEMMGLTVPADLTLEFKAPGEIASLPELVPETLVLVSSPKDAWLCLQAGLVPEKLNIGGMHAKPGKEEVLEALHLDGEDRAFFEKILEKGFMPIFQPTPQNDPTPLNEIL